jgi:hypothetical protein
VAASCWYFHCDNADILQGYLSSVVRGCDNHGDSFISVPPGASGVVTCMHHRKVADSAEHGAAQHAVSGGLSVRSDPKSGTLTAPDGVLQPLKAVEVPGSAFVHIMHARCWMLCCCYSALPSGAGCDSGSRVMPK